jgi:two-component system, chemotaxis family, protein-glutamate methylesterase/glutaminase
MSGWIPLKKSTGKSGEAESPAVAYQIVVVGTSWGGLAALRMLVEALPPEYVIPTAIVQHRSRDSDAMLARFLQDHTQLRVCEIEDKQPIETGRLFLAPANYHTLVEQGHFSLSTEAPVRFSRPSIDVTMTSAAIAYGHRAVGVVLTGANADGADGLRRIASSGGMAVIQDPATAEVKAMPAAALQAVPTARVFALERIAPFLGTLPSNREHMHGTA